MNKVNSKFTSVDEELKQILNQKEAQLHFNRQIKEVDIEDILK